MNSKPNFKLPNTKQCTVRYADGQGRIQETPAFTTPANSPALIHTMLMTHKVGYGQIRAVKAVESSTLVDLRQVNLGGILPQKFVRGNRLEPMFV